FPPPPNLPSFRSSAEAATQPNVAVTPARLTTPAAPRRLAAARATGSARIKINQSLVVRPWNPNSSNWAFTFGKVLLGKSPVSGARVRVDGFTLPSPTGPQGGFSYPADITDSARHEVRIVDLSRAKVRGHRPSARQQAQLKAVRAGISVGYRMTGLHAKVQSNGTVLVTGRMTNTAGVAPPPVGLYKYRMSGTITNAAGQPVQGAVVIARTNDRDFWTFSAPSDANGHYTSLFHASDELETDPVPINIGVAVGQVSYGGNLGTVANFARNRSATLDVQLKAGT